MDYRYVIQTIKIGLADLTPSLKLVDLERLRSLQARAINDGENIWDVLQKGQFFTTEEFYKALSGKFHIETKWNYSTFETNNENFPYKFCFTNGIIPIHDDGTLLQVGIGYPKTLTCLRNLSLLVDRKTKAYFLTIEVIEEVLLEQSDIPRNIFLTKSLQSTPATEHSAVATNGLIEGFYDTPYEEGRVVNEEHLARAEGQDSTEIPKEIKPEELSTHQDNIPSLQKNDTPAISRFKQKPAETTSSRSLGSDVVKGIDEILSLAVDTKVSDIHFEIFKDTAGIRFRRNGSLIAMDAYKKFIMSNYPAVTARLKIMADLDIAERRLPQDGKISFKSKSGTECDFRVSVLPTGLGERIVIRILNSSGLAVSVDALGFTPVQLEIFTSVIESPQGLVLVTGPTGSGKSTTLYGAINHLNNPDVNILTAEDPVEYTLSGVSQVQVRENIGLTFANVLRSFLRQDPEIVLVGEIRDAETADIATKAALTGHLVLSTLHTNSAIGAITRLINMGLPKFLVSSALTMVVAQRLIRINCKNCIVPQEVNLDKFHPILQELLKEKQLSKGQGCEKCSFTGYSGRKAVHEVLRINTKIQHAIDKELTESEILEFAIADGFETMAISAVRYLTSGELSFQEYLQVVPQNYGEERIK